MVLGWVRGDHNPERYSLILPLQPLYELKWISRIREDVWGPVPEQVHPGGIPELF